MKKDLLKVLIIFFVLLFVFMIIVVSMLYYINKKNNNSIPEGASNPLDTYGDNFNGGIDYQSYFDVKACMKKYINCIDTDYSKYISYDENDNEIMTVDENALKQRSYNVLSKKFIKENNITLENIYEKIETVKDSPIFVPVEITLIQDNNYVKSFLVYGLIESQYNYSLINKIYAIVNIDFNNAAFSIEPISGNYLNVNEIKIEKFDELVNNNKDNSFASVFIEEEDIPKEYFDLCNQLAIGAPEELYELLDEKYKSEKFENINEFKEYINKNKSKIIRARLSAYQKENNEQNNTVRYICVDQHDNYYVINQEETLQNYTVMLDKYTINLKEFEEKYDFSEGNVKVALNIEKILEALKLKDYKYVYNKLDNTFKEKKFKTQENFEEYIEKIYNTDMEIEYKNYEKINDIYTYNIEIKKDESKKSDIKIVMQLKEERDFIFSFSVED